MNLEYTDLLKKIKKYVLYCDKINALALIGSHSKKDDFYDEYSDLDLIIVTNDVNYFFSNDTWLKSIDEVWMTFTESVIDANHWERRVIFRNGLDVDFIIIDEKILLDKIDQLPIAREISNMNILIDKKELYYSLKKLYSQSKPFSIPSFNEFNNIVNDFYFHYLWAYKKLMRGEYWVTLQCLNGYLKNLLLKMLEIYEHILHGRNYNTFYNGRFIEKWVDSDISIEFTKLFSRNNPDEIKDVLNFNFDFFTKISMDAAEKLNYSFPKKEKDELKQWVLENYSSNEVKQDNKEMQQKIPLAY